MIITKDMLDEFIYTMDTLNKLKIFDFLTGNTFDIKTYISILNY